MPPGSVLANAQNTINKVSNKFAWLITHQRSCFRTKIHAQGILIKCNNFTQLPVSITREILYPLSDTDTNLLTVYKYQLFS